jgi:gentisate 1,2-dioxygenase
MALCRCLGELLKAALLTSVVEVAAGTLCACNASDSNASCKSNNDAWIQPAEIYEYTSTANPKMTEIPIRVFGPELHQEGPSRIIPMDLSSDLELAFPATSPNLMGNFVRILIDETISTGVSKATSQVFYVIRGQGKSLTRVGEVAWQEGDLFVIPYLGDEATPVCEDKSQCVKHTCSDDPQFGGCALYWVHDEPLLNYLGVRPASERRFEPTLYPGGLMKDAVAAISNMDAEGQVRNRRGILLGNAATPQTKTLTPTMWSLLNTLGAHADQHPHKHNSVALDLAVSGGEEGTVYTLLGRELNADGSIVNPQRAEWKSGGVFVTPPGWWHSHHNEGNLPAWVLPVQDAGLYTHQRTLDIRFMEGETQLLKKGTSRGATLPDKMSEPVPPMIAGTIMTGHM